MADGLIPESVKKFWDERSIQSFLILSFSLQMFLVIFAPFRKKTANMWMSFLIWSGYLLADWAATFAIGLIFRSQGDNDSAFADSGSLMALWAPFLLLHLGGPDTITAFALADNALWVRHLFRLVVHLAAAVYVLLYSLPKDKLKVPTILMLIAGVFKYLERVRALFQATLKKLQESDEPRQHHLIGSQMALRPKCVPLREEELILTSYNYFKVFQGFFVDLYLAWSKRSDSRAFFLSTTPEDALRIILTELNFMYEVLYTKVIVVRSKIGFLLRAISFSIVICVLALFVRVEKHRFHHVDVVVTYILLFGAAALDVTSLLMLIFSEWTLVSIQMRIEHRNRIEDRKSDSVLHHYFSRLDHYFSRILSCVLSLKKPTWSEHDMGPDDAKLTEFGTWVVFRRWSESISCCNLISYSISQRPARKIRKSCWGCFSHLTVPLPRWLLSYFSKFECWNSLEKCIRCLGLRDILDKMAYASKNPLDKKLWDFIFNELRRKSRFADTPDQIREICDARGCWVLDHESEAPLKPYVKAFEFSKSVLTWHVATELCYNTDSSDDGSSSSSSSPSIEVNEQGEFSANEQREFSKALSDYMLYLMLMQPTMTSVVRGSFSIMFDKTVADSKKGREKSYPAGIHKGSTKVERESERLLEAPTLDVYDSKTESALWDAQQLARELKELRREDRWRIVSRVWVEMLSYAAIHCRAAVHAQALSKGGELLSLVWILLAHFGIGKRFKLSEGHPDDINYYPFFLVRN